MITETVSGHNCTTLRFLEFMLINFPSAGAAADHVSRLNYQIIHCFPLSPNTAWSQSVEVFYLYSNQTSSVPLNQAVC